MCATYDVTLDRQAPDRKPAVLAPEEPYRYLARLEKAYIETRRSRTGEQLFGPTAPLAAQSLLPGRSCRQNRLFGTDFGD